GKRLRGAFPQAGLLPRLRPGMLVLADRNFAGYVLWRGAAATGAQLLWRIGASFALPAGEVLAGGTYLSVLKAPATCAGTAPPTSSCGSSSTGSRTPPARSPRRSP